MFLVPNKVTTKDKTVRKKIFLLQRFKDTKLAIVKWGNVEVGNMKMCNE